MPDFHETRFPEIITIGAEIGPDMPIDIVEFASGKEQRNQRHSEFKVFADVAKAIQTDEEYDIVLAFFRARRAMLHGFRWKDWSDFRCIQEPALPTVGDGFLDDFQIVKNYEEIAEPPASAAIRIQVRQLFKIRGSTNGGGDPILTPDSPGTIVRVNGSSVTIIWTGSPSGGQVLINPDTGLMTFGTAPSAGHTVDFTGEFDIAARFDTRRMAGTLDDFNATSANNIPIKELNLLNGP